MIKRVTLNTNLIAILTKVKPDLSIRTPPPPPHGSEVD